MTAVRLLDAADAIAFREFRLAGLAESPASFGSGVDDEQSKTTAEWRDRVTPTDASAVFGAFEDRDLVGVVRVVREAGLKQMHRASITSMYVAPAARHRGVAAELLQRALSHAQCWEGLRQVELAVTVGNASAIRLYQRFNFVEFGRVPAALFVDGEYHDELFMVCVLQSAS